MERKIKILSLVLAIGGLLSNLSYLFNDPPYLIYTIPRYLFDFLNFGYMDRGDFIVAYGERLNFIDIFMCLLFVAGALVFAVNPRENRIIRFIYSLILFEKVFLIAALITEIIITKYPVPAWSYIISFAWCIILIVISTLVLKWFDSGRKLQVNVIQTPEGPENTLREAGRWHRFINVNADDFIFSFAITPILCSLLQITTRKDPDDDYYLTSKIDPLTKLSLFIIILLVLRWLYYFLYETFFQHTPGKILTQTCVTDANGEKPSAGTIALRSLIRFVPFNALSFLGKRGWHDSWSDSYVIKEDRGTKSGKAYYLALPVFILVMISGNYIYKASVQHKKEADLEYIFNVRRQKNEKILQTLNHNDVLILLNTQDSTSVLYMQPKEIGKSKITFRIARRSKFTGLDFCGAEMEEFFLPEYDMDTVLLTPTALQQANITFDQTPIRNNGTYAHTLQINGIQYTMYTTVNINGPDIVQESERYYTSHLEDKTEIRFVNKGKTVKVQNLTNNNKDGIVWKVSDNLLEGDCSGYPNYNMYSNKPFRGDVDLTLVVQDLYGNTFTYHIYGSIQDYFRPEMFFIRTKN